LRELNDIRGFLEAELQRARSSSLRMSINPQVAQADMSAAGKLVPTIDVDVYHASRGWLTINRIVEHERTAVLGTPRSSGAERSLFG
jgi:hypothetical protein